MGGGGGGGGGGLQSNSHAFAQSRERKTHYTLELQTSVDLTDSAIIKCIHQSRGTRKRVGEFVLTFQRMGLGTDIIHIVMGRQWLTVI